MKKYRPIDPKRIHTRPLSDRASKVRIGEHFARPPVPGMSVAELVDSLPRLLGAESLRAVADAVVAARDRGKPVVLAMGGHVIKCGLQPVIRTLIDAGAVTAVAMNGSAAIHDFEISLIGATSEDVAAELPAGCFGFAEETGQGIHLALREGLQGGEGFGAAVARRIVEENHPFREFSLLATCFESRIPVTVHVAIGADIIHQHPDFDGGATGEMSARDFRLLAGIVGELGDGGVWINAGSAVIMPEVFLKALSIARNLGFRVDRFTTADFDMIRHYRPMTNVVQRPNSHGGLGFAVTGHHEIVLPLLAATILNRIAQGG